MNRSRKRRPAEPPRNRRRAPLPLRAAICSAALLLLTACDFGAPPGASTQGKTIAGLYHVLWYFAIPVGVIVYGLILWSILRYRKRRDDDGELPKQTRYAGKLEVTYTVIPILMVAAIFGFTYHAEQKVDRMAPNPAVTVDVDGFQWEWRFTYEGQGVTIVGTPGNVPTLMLPAGETTQIVLRSEDVVHAFYVSAFLFQRQAIPGVVNRFDLTVPSPGVWPGVCSQYCGLDHTSMDFTVRAVSPAAFQAWLAQQRAAQGATGGPST